MVKFLVLRRYEIEKEGNYDVSKKHKLLKKYSRRMKELDEKCDDKLGRTADEQLDEHENNFKTNKQSEEIIIL